MPVTEPNRFGIMGTGAWGTALAVATQRSGRHVKMWGRDADTATALSSGRGNPTYLPDIQLPPIEASTDPAILADSEAILAVIPAQGLRPALTEAAAHIARDTPVILCAKGIEQSSLKLMTQVLQETVPDVRAAILSGPSFAHDVARGLPTAVTLACEDEPLGQALVHAIGHTAFRPYWTNDLVGVEIGGAVKNVLAIACGVVEGLELGRSAHAALLSRGFAEMRRLAVTLGAQDTTLSGLSGLGDLVLTCSSSQSRNMSFGIALGRGELPHTVLASRRTVVEGAATAPAIAQLAKKHGVDMPICLAVADILAEKITVDGAIKALLERPFKGEI